MMVGLLARGGEDRIWRAIGTDVLSIESRLGDLLESPCNLWVTVQ